MNKSKNRARVAVLISGNGSNLQALMEACRNDVDYPAEIVLVLSNKAEAYGLKRAESFGIATITLSHRDYPDREAFDMAIHQRLQEHQIDIVCLAGFMRLLTPSFVLKWEGRMLNIHPSLLPDYKGLDTHARVIADKQQITGCTVHYVVPEMDAGPIILQEQVAVLPQDDPETLAQRVHQAEYRIYPEALKQVAAEFLVHR